MEEGGVVSLSCRLDDADSSNLLHDNKLYLVGNLLLCINMYSSVSSNDGKKLETKVTHSPHTNISHI